jgi:hypothetical protein
LLIFFMELFSFCWDLRHADVFVIGGPVGAHETKNSLPVWKAVWLSTLIRTNDNKPDAVPG